jgi:hypothetical protein
LDRIAFYVHTSVCLFAGNCPCDSEATQFFLGWRTLEITINTFPGSEPRATSVSCTTQGFVTTVLFQCRNRRYEDFIRTWIPSEQEVNPFLVGIESFLLENTHLLQ